MEILEQQSTSLTCSNIFIYRRHYNRRSYKRSKKLYRDLLNKLATSYHVPLHCLISYDNEHMKNVFLLHLHGIPFFSSLTALSQLKCLLIQYKNYPDCLDHKYQEYEHVVHQDQQTMCVHLMNYLHSDRSHLHCYLRCWCRHFLLPGNILNSQQVTALPLWQQSPTHHLGLLLEVPVSPLTKFLNISMR